MNGIGERELGATNVLHEKLSCSRVGLRWERILRTHAREVDILLAVHPDVREHVGDALCWLAGAGEACNPLDETTVAAVSRVLDDLQRLGTIDLQRSVSGLREELALARGRSLDDVLAG